jgi:hypothetical protein
MQVSFKNHPGSERPDIRNVLKRIKLSMETMVRNESVLLPSGECHRLSRSEMEALLISLSCVSVELDRLGDEPGLSDVQLRDVLRSDMLLIRLAMEGIRTVLDMWRCPPERLADIILGTNGVTSGKHPWHAYSFICPDAAGDR